MCLAENIRFLRKKKNMSQEELASLLGYKSYTTIQKWESGASEPPLKSLRKMSEIFDTDMDAMAESRLMTDADKFWESTQDFNAHHQESASVQSFRIPVLGRVAAGIPIDAIEEVLDWEELPGYMANHGKYFGLKIRGDSMEPGISNNDVVIVREQEDAEDGQIVIALVNGNDGVCKRLKKYDNGSIALVSDNAAYTPIYFNRAEQGEIPVRIRGVVKELRRKL